MAGSRYENDILWLYSNGIVSGVNDNSNLRPKSNATRAECCTMVVTLLHPERWKQIDWDAVTAGTESSGSQTSSGTDFKGKTRIRYSNDVAYDFRRALEEQIGIQIFYLPEWTPKEAGVLQYEGIRQLGIDQEYFTRVLAELRGHSQRLEHYLLHPGELQQQLFRIKWSGRGQISYIYFNCLFIIDCYTIIIVCRRAPIVYLSIWDAHKQTYLRQRAIFLPGKRLNTRLRSYGPF